MQELTEKGTKDHFEVKEMFCFLIVVMVTQMYTDLQTYQVVNINYVFLMSAYLNKGVFKKERTVSLATLSPQEYHQRSPKGETGKDHFPNNLPQQNTRS